MSIELPNEKTAPVYFPKENYKIARYLDLVKFVSLIQTNKIFFTRLDRFEDKYEGSIPALTEIEYKNWYKTFTEKRLLNTINSSVDEHVEKTMIAEREARERYKKLVCVSCWNRYSSESYALWKIYSDLSKGIMITTNVEKLITSFKNTKEEIQLSEIRYINYKSEKMPLGNMNYPIIHKNIHYDYEKEIRLIHTVKFEGGLIYDWSKEENEFGKYIENNISELIDEIIVSPYSPSWFFDIITNICDKYNLQKNIRYSDLK